MTDLPTPWALPNIVERVIERTIADALAKGRQLERDDWMRVLRGMRHHATKETLGVLDDIIWALSPEGPNRVA